VTTRIAIDSATVEWRDALLRVDGHPIIVRRARTCGPAVDAVTQVRGPARSPGMSDVFGLR